MGNITSALEKANEKLGADFGSIIATLIERESPQWVGLVGRDTQQETYDKPTELLLLWAVGEGWWEPALLKPDWAEALRGSWDEVYVHQYEQWVEKWMLL